MVGGVSDRTKPGVAPVDPPPRGSLDPHYLGFFECYNAGRFFEAHEVLEELWLEERRRPDGNFYKALIQVAGCFVHLQHDRLGPAAALLRTAAAHLAPFPSSHHGLDIDALREQIAAWRAVIEGQARNPLAAGPVPTLRLAEV